MKKTLRIVLHVDVRDMTDEEFEEAGGMEWATDEEDSGPEGFVASCSPQELAEIIAESLSSEDNPEMFAGTNQFMVTENARAVETTWLP